MKLTPGPGFNPALLNWGAPDQARTETCSYCAAPLGDDEVPLILWRADGWCVELCTVCSANIFGLRSYGP